MVFLEAAHSNKDFTNSGLFTCFQHCKCFNTTANQRFPEQRREALLTVDGDAGLRFVILAGNLPDVEGLGGRFGQQAEHEDDGVSVRKAVRVDVSAQRETEAVSYYSASSSRKSPTLEETTEEAETNRVGHFTALAQRVLLGWLLLKPTQRD